MSSNTEIARHLDRLEWLAVSYLFLPVLVFLLGWLRWPFAPILGSLAAIGWTLTPWKRSLARPCLSWGGVLLVLGVAGLWVAMSGLVPPFHLNDDWQFRMSVLRDLTLGDWPVAYGSVDPAQPNLILRFPMGFYLFPALLAKALGGSEAIGRWLLVPWTLLGVVLFAVLTLTATLPQAKPIRITHLLWPLLLLIGFSGMDLLGWLLMRRAWPPQGAHIEWWAGLFQYSSHTTLLFWVPNHALAGWIAGSLVWRHRQQGLTLGAASLLLVGVVTWAPLVALGLAPLLLACTWRGQSLSGWIREWWNPGLLALVLPGLFICRFMTFGVPSGSLQMSWQALGSVGSWLILFVLFAVLEWALIALLIFRGGEGSWLLGLAAATLLVLPLFNLGVFNDLVMRGGIPAMTVLFCATLAVLTKPRDLERYALMGLGLILAIGSFTPLNELRRAVVPRDRFASRGRNFVQINGLPWHYLAPLNNTWIQGVLAEPKILPPGPAAPKNRP